LFGWIISGSWQCSRNVSELSSQLLCMNDIPESMLRQFWDLDSIGIRPDDSVEVWNRSYSHKVQ
jgi:hypothetical protein